MKTLKFNVEKLSAEQMSPIKGGYNCPSASVSDTGKSGHTESSGADSDSKSQGDRDSDYESMARDLASGYVEREF
jgi:natural product precursor